MAVPEDEPCFENLHSYAIVPRRYDRRMDVLSDVISVDAGGSAALGAGGVARAVGAAVRGRARLRRLPGDPAGTVLAHPADGDPVPLAAGDVVLRPHGRGHTLADSPSTPPAPACDPDDPPRAATLRQRPPPAPPPAPRRRSRCAAATGSTPPGPTRCCTTCPSSSTCPPTWAGTRDLRATVDLLAAELEHPRLGTDAIVPALLDTLLLHVLRAWLEQQPARGTATGWAAALNDPPVAAALQAMHRDPSHPWTVATLAAEAGLSRTPSPAASPPCSASPR